MTDAKKKTDNRPDRPQTINECIAAVKHACHPQMLFDEFWREGELAILFGPPGVGKSLFAVQLADALAAGRSIGTFRMPGYRRKTLFVDLVMSPAKFRLRYTYRPGINRESRVYKFSDYMFSERPTSAIGAWLREQIEKNRFEVIVIDDLAALRQTDDGTGEALRIMRELKSIADEMSVAILVLTTSVPPPRSQLVSEADLRRTRAICNVVDTAFALGYHPRAEGSRYMIQTRSRNSAPIWNETNAPIGRIGLNERMMLAFGFDKRFAERLDPEVLETILKIKAGSDRGKPQRAIAEELNISISRVRRLLKKWTPDMERNGELRNENGRQLATDEQSAISGQRSAVSNQRSADSEQRRVDSGREEEPEEWDEAGFERPEWMDFERTGASGELVRAREPDGNGANETVETTGKHEGTRTARRGIDPSRIPFAAGLARRSVYDLEPAMNAYGREIFVDEWEGDRRRPRIWYEINKQGVLVKYIRSSTAITTTYLGKTHYLERKAA